MMTTEELQDLLGRVTPGPWRVGHTVIQGRVYGGAWVEAPDDLLIPITGSGGAMSYTAQVINTQGHDHNDDNATLIAIAPDLAAEVIRLRAELAQTVAANAQLVADAAEVRDAYGPLVFSNVDALPKNVSIQCDNSSVPDIMSWYGAYFAGDRYTVSFSGRNVAIDQNGEPTTAARVALKGGAA